MVKFNNTDIPESKFAEVTIGNNGVRIVQNNESIKITENMSKQVPDTVIYLSAEDIMQIFSKFIVRENDNDEIETIYFNADNNNDEDDDKIIEASY